jgi:hypothetical protein
VIGLNRKVLGIAVALMAVAMLATPMVGAANACFWSRRIVKQYSASYMMHNTVPPVTEVKGDYIIMTKGEGQGDYSSDLGTGTMSTVLIKTVINTVTGEGWQLIKNTVVITAGSYGTGTLVGYSWFKTKSTPTSFTVVDGGTFLSGRLGCKYVTVMAEKGYTAAGPGVQSVWEEGRMTIW